MPKQFDPSEGLSPEDLQYINSQKDAFSRQQAAHAMHGSDESRKAAAEAHRRETMRQHGVEVPEELPNAPVSSASQSPAAGLSGTFSVLRAVPEVESVGHLPQAAHQYAPDWALMKERISGHDGIWVVSRFEFVPHVAFILGFFEKEGWESPPDAKKESFEVIVKNGRVFRTDPE